jgi:hypothetical protein
MTTTQSSPVMGVFTDRGAADAAIDQLQEAGFSSEQLSLSHRQGALSGKVKHLFSKLPGQEGSIVDELQRMGVPEDEALYYQNELNAGRVIVTVQADGRQEDAREVLESNGAYDINTRPETTNPS